MLLSDIPVHREQAQGLAHFFSSDSVVDLARALKEFEPVPLEQRLALQRTSAAQARQRVARFASDFVELVNRTRYCVISRG
jgi:hypothetical protein